MPDDSQSVLEISGISSRKDDPVKEINALILQLQETTKEAQAQLRIAEDERERYAAELASEREQHRLQSLRNKETIAKLQAQLEQSNGDPDEVARLRDENKRLNAFTRRVSNEATEYRDAADEKLHAANRRQEDLLKQKDAAIAASENFKKELLRVKKQFDELMTGSAGAVKEAADLKKSVAELKTELASAKKQVSAIKQARDTAANNLTDLKSKVAEMEDKIAELNDRCEAAERQAPEAPSRPKPQAQSDEVEVLRRELEILSENHQAAILQHETAVEKLRAELTENKSATVSGSDSDTAKLRAEIAIMKQRFEKQRLDTIEISATLENAQRDVRDMSANLAEARLLLKAGKPFISRASGRTRAKMGDGKKNLAAMRKAAQGLIENFANETAWSDLFERSLLLVEAAEKHGGGAMIRVATAVAGLLCQTQSTPGAITHSLVRTLNQALDFLVEIPDQAPAESNAAIANIRVFVVDDDASCGEVISTAFDTVGVTATTTQFPGEAISELVTTAFDLILLDVGLPELDGFELGAQIREMDANAETPIIYLTGDDSAENRNEAMRQGGDDFLSKPFNVTELGLRGLLLVLRTRLQMV